MCCPLVRGEDPPAPPLSGQRGWLASTWLELVLTIGMSVFSVVFSFWNLPHVRIHISVESIRNCAVPLPSAGCPCKSKVTSCWPDKNIGMSKYFLVFRMDRLTDRWGKGLVSSTVSDMEEMSTLTSKVLDGDYKTLCSTSPQHARTHARTHAQTWMHRHFLRI